MCKLKCKQEVKTMTTMLPLGLEEAPHSSSSMLPSGVGEARQIVLTLLFAHRVILLEEIYT